MFKKESGITLVALVVTIIVLLILAGVAISLAIGNNGIFTRAKDAADKYEQSATNESNGMNEFEKEFDETQQKYFD